MLGMCSLRPKRLFLVDSKGNVKEFFGSGFGRFRLVSRWCLGLFGSKATACVLLLEAFGKWGNWLDDGFIGWACAGHVLLRPKRLFLVDSKGDVKEFFGLRFWPFSARVQMVFGPFRSA